MPSQDRIEPSLSHFINPHRLFHGMWMPQWLEERPEVSEKAKKLYAHLTYFAGGKGYAWPSFNHLAEKLHVSRRYVIKLVQELSAHRLIAVTHVDNPAKGYCTNHYRFLWHPWMQTAEDGDFRLVVREEQASFSTAEPAPLFTSPSPSSSVLRRIFGFIRGMGSFSGRQSTTFCTIFGVLGSSRPRQCRSSATGDQDA